MNYSEDNFKVLIPDGEHYSLIAILDCFSHVKGCKIYVMSDTKSTIMAYSRYIEHYSFYPNTTDDLEWISNIDTEVERHNIDIILPIYESRIRTLVNLGKHLTYKDKLVLLPSSKSYEIASNKWLLALHLKEFDIHYPKSLIARPDGFKVFENMDMTFPILIKPHQGTSGGDGIFKFESKEELRAHFKNNTLEEIHLIQEYINGYDIDCNVLCEKGKILAFTIQKGFMSGKKAFSPHIGLNMVFEPDLLITVKKLMKSLNWSGVAHVDLRFDEQSKTFKVLEINPRYWATLHASLMANVNFPYLQCITTLGRKYDIPDYEHIQYLNLNGLFQRIGKNKLFVFRWRYIWKITPVKYILKDPFLNVFKLVRITKNILKKKFALTLNTQ